MSIRLSRQHLAVEGENWEKRPDGRGQHSERWTSNWVMSRQWIQSFAQLEIVLRILPNTAHAIYTGKICPLGPTTCCRQPTRVEHEIDAGITCVSTYNVSVASCWECDALEKFKKRSKTGSVIAATLHEHMVSNQPASNCSLLVWTEAWSMPALISQKKYRILDYRFVVADWEWYTYVLPLPGAHWNLKLSVEASCAYLGLVAVTCAIPLHIMSVHTNEGCYTLKHEEFTIIASTGREL